MKNELTGGLEEMTLWLRRVAALEKDLDSASSAYIIVHNHVPSSPRRFNAIF